MQVTMSFPEKEFIELLERFQRETGKSWPDVLKQQGRLIAVNLAFNTQPYGFDDGARDLGRGAVLRDIGIVFSTISKAYDGLKEKSEKAARAFYSAAVTGKIARAQRILQANGVTVPIGTLKAQVHKDRRNRRGRVKGKKDEPSQIVKNSKSIDTYSKKIQGRVGFGKSGWASCAGVLGGVRGIAHWAKRGKGPGTVDDQSKSINNPHVKLQNNVRYVKLICPDSAVKAAVRIQKEKMEKHIEHVINAAGKKAGMQ